MNEVILLDYLLSIDPTMFFLFANGLVLFTVLVFAFLWRPQIHGMSAECLEAGPGHGASHRMTGICPGVVRTPRLVIRSNGKEVPCRCSCHKNG